MRFLCGNLDLKIIIFDYKQRLLVARLWYLETLVKSLKKIRTERFNDTTFGSV